MANFKIIIVQPDSCDLYDVDEFGKGGVIVDHVADLIMRENVPDSRPPITPPPGPKTEPVQE